MEIEQKKKAQSTEDVRSALLKGCVIVGEWLLMHITLLHMSLSTEKSTKTGAATMKSRYKLFLYQ